MDAATVLIISIAAMAIAITLMAIYSSVGPGAKNLEDPFLNHTHGPEGHNHGFFHSHGPSLRGHSHAHDHSHSHAHGHSHSHDHSHAHAHVHDHSKQKVSQS
ncbi:MAG: photosystem II reaction center protein PsbN [Leptolyngbyaceae cyanobacterium]